MTTGRTACSGFLEHGQVLLRQLLLAQFLVLDVLQEMNLVWGVHFAVTEQQLAQLVVFAYCSFT